MTTSSDKLRDFMRYERAAQSTLQRMRDAEETSEQPYGASAIDRVFRAPYAFFETRIRQIVRKEHRVLELGAGTGAHTRVLLQCGARVTASDISSSALRALVQAHSGIAEGRLVTRRADIEQLPFADSSFDVVTCAGSLSYGDPTLVDAEIRRVLTEDGVFICVDSLNDNPVYWFNRWLQWLRGVRTRSTVTRMPTVKRVEAISARYRWSEVKYFGSVTWAVPTIARIVGDERAAALSDLVDGLVGVKRSAFKFVLVVAGHQ